MGLDIARCKTSMVPVVQVAADPDSDSVTAIHHNINKAIGGKLEYTMADANDKWIYSTERNISDDANLLEDGLAFTDESAAIASGDLIKLLYVKHRAIDTNGDSTSSNLWITIDGSTPSASNAKGFILEPNEAMLLKPTGLTHDNLHGKAASGSINIEYTAIVDDISE